MTGTMARFTRPRRVPWPVSAAAGRSLYTPENCSVADCMFALLNTPMLIARRIMQDSYNR